MKGEELYEMIELELSKNEFDMPTSIEIPNESYTNFWNYIDKEKLNGKDFGIFIVKVNDEEIDLYSIPVDECFDIVKKEGEKDTKKKLPFKLIFEGKQGELKSNH